jgi:hypothetical protein
MIESRELISATRQLGSMTEAGVDILRAIKVLRAQTQNAELMSLYDRLAHELRLGSGLADAMSHAPEGFSAFAVSIVRQGEARGDLATSFYRIADYLQKEREADSSIPESAPSGIIPKTNAPPEKCPPWLRRVLFRTLVALSALFAILFFIEIFVALNFIEPRWHLSCLTFVVTAFFLCVAGILHHTIPTQTPQPFEDKSTFDKDNKGTSEETSEATFE